VLLERIQDEAKDKQLKAARTNFSAFFDQIRSIDPAPLEGKAALHWREISILLQNDATLGREAQDIPRLQRILDETRAHFKRLTRTFSLESGTDSRDRQFEAPEIFKDQLGRVVRAYVRLKEALAEDDLSGAQTAAAQTAEALQQVDMGLLDHDPHLAWMDLLSTINQGLAVMREAGDLLAMRTGFDPLSKALIAAVESLGVNIEGPLFVLTCPMAFENKGAQWLQQDEKIRNPYFGAAMYRCGEVKRQIKAPQQHKGTHGSS
ncbi:MAG: DUF3347 domain-containing protein, partial [Desulfohalobiaceae bacterium]|nr:DUF3347 domain-containing protein [Desulfohalobiaceae bacterium]